MLTLEKNSPEAKTHKNYIDNLNIQQHTIKILINTIYGYFGNKHSPLGDDELAESITLTGQAVIKQSNKLLIDYIKDKTGLTDADIEKDTPIIYNDTDSSYISIKHIVQKLNIKMLNKKNEITDEYLKEVQDIEDYLNTEIKTIFARANAPIVDGSATVNNIALQAIAGLGVRFANVKPSRTKNKPKN
jgi:DNA polymerase elongation subunit (family B)